MHVVRLVGAHGAPGVRSVTQPSRRRWLAICAAMLAMPWALTAGAVCYVNAAAAGANTGASWTDAYTDLQSALTNASCSEIWVAQGVYTPSASAPTVSFNIGPGVAVYGGFSGSETSRGARNPAAHVTTLSGVISGGKSQNIVVLNGTVTGKPITATTVLDGFTLTGGSSTSTGTGSLGTGGALWCHGSGAGHECSPTLANLVFSNNHANYGGALYLDGSNAGASNPTLTNITFSGNSAVDFGGAMYSNAEGSGSVCSPTLTNVTFSANTSASYAGAMANDGGNSGNSSPVLTNVTFSGNSATSNGGAMFNIGGTSNPMLTNVTFSGNSANIGGGIYSSGNNAATNITTLNSVILWGDSAPGGGPEMYMPGPAVANVYYGVIQGGCPLNASCSNLSTSDPNLGSLANNGGFTQTLMPGAGSGTGSSAINAVPCYLAPLTDQRDAARPDPASVGLTNRCDMGAVEANSLPGDFIFADSFGSTPRDL